MLRSAVERFSRGKLIRRRLPRRFNHVPLYVSPDSQLKYMKPGEAAFDLELLKVVETFISDTSIVWDIGANVGVFSFAAAGVAKNGSVLAVEADIWLAQIVRKSLLLNENKNLNVDVLPCAIANEDGVATFLIAQRGRASNSLESIGGHSQTGGVRERVSVPTLTLDTLLNHFKAPTFLKVDVEGAETMVLQGATRLLRDIRPMIYIEVGDEENAEVTKILTESNYRLYDISKDIVSQTPMEKCLFNTLAIPY